jgi:hypothetical protein
VEKFRSLGTDNIDSYEKEIIDYLSILGKHSSAPVVSEILDSIVEVWTSKFYLMKL